MFICTAVSSEAWAKLRDWASVASRGRLLLSGSVAHASLKTAVYLFYTDQCSAIGELTIQASTCQILILHCSASPRLSTSATLPCLMSSLHAGPRLSLKLDKR